MKIRSTLGWDLRRAALRQELLPLVEAGISVDELAAKYGISRQGASYRLKTAGLSAMATEIKASRTRQKAEGKLAAREARCLASKGCSLAVYRELQGNGATAAFTQQRQNSRNRGIEWRLTLGEWWEIWSKSGLWDARGRTKGGYVMGRHGDQGPYAVGNVAIVTHSQNAKVAQSHATAGKGGVYKTVPGMSKPWTAYKNKKCLGYFATEEEARNFRSCV